MNAPLRSAQSYDGEEFAHILRITSGAGNDFLLRLLGTPEEIIEPLSAFLAVILEYRHVALLTPYDKTNIIPPSNLINDLSQPMGSGPRIPQK